ncbi:MAG: TonB-dependent receptor, partial [bacterium]
LPDQNAAESVGRLPGISIQRDAGEGQKVIVRGLSPRFNSITVNGERIPSTDPENRSIDLSMLSPDVLAGIEVFKALTPDKDADAIGGTVNFVTKKAKEGLQTDTRIQTGYNGHEDEYGQYKGSTSISNRYFNNKIGIVLTGSMQRANRSSDYLDADYYVEGEKEDGTANILINKLNLGDRFEIRKRYSASLALDYELKDGEILLNSFWGKTDRDEFRRRRRYLLDTNRQERAMRDRQLETQLWTNSISGKHYIFPLGLPMILDWRASYSKTKQKAPFSHTVRFYELSAFKPSLIEDKGPDYIPLGAYNRLDETYFKSSLLEQEWVDDGDLTVQLDLKIPFGLSKDIAGHFKLGGKYRGKNRDREVSAIITSDFGLMWDLPVRYPDRWELDSQGRILFNNFVDLDYAADDFLKGRYDFGPGLHIDRLNDFLHTYRDEYFSDDPLDPDSLYEYDPEVLIESYEASERITAGYLMMELNIGQKLMFLPGVRYERTVNDYATIYAMPVTTEDEERLLLTGIIDTTGYRIYDEFLPMVHMRYKPTSWFDIRLAITRSLTRPDYYNLVPWRNFKDDGATLEQGNPDLRSVKSWNYDAFLSFYGRLGLFTIGMFSKEVDNVDYIRTRRVKEEEKKDYGNVNIIIQPENVEGTTKVKGFEVELQTNLKSLPSPLDGIVIYANYSHVSSETFYPFLLVERGGPPFFRPIYIDTLRSASMIGQADHIVNFSVGYEKAGFSGRISMIYQGKILKNVDLREELDEYDNDFLRWDITMQQKIFEGVSLFLNLNNISDRSEGTFLWKEVYPTSEEFFGWTADLGIRYKF